MSPVRGSIRDVHRENSLGDTRKALSWRVRPGSMSAVRITGNPPDVTYFGVACRQSTMREVTCLSRTLPQWDGIWGRPKISDLLTGTLASTPCVTKRLMAVFFCSVRSEINRCLTRTASPTSRATCCTYLTMASCSSIGGTGRMFGPNWLNRKSVDRSRIPVANAEIHPDRAMCRTSRA